MQAIKVIKTSIAILLSASPLLAEARTPRSKHAIAEFKRHHPCPATGQPRGPCPGYIIDHVTPLCSGGSDHPVNMQWQTVAEAKDREERKMCIEQRTKQ